MKLKFYQSNGSNRTNLMQTGGDNDFNDLAIDHNFNEIMNSAQKILQIDCLSKITTIGASYFGTEDDDTNLGSGTYYKLDVTLPWAMHLPVSLEYPTEKTAILKGQVMFGQWVQSNGFSFIDWYENKPAYRNIKYLNTADK